MKNNETYTELSMPLRPGANCYRITIPQGRGLIFKIITIGMPSELLKELDGTLLSYKGLLRHLEAFTDKPEVLDETMQKLIWWNSKALVFCRRTPLPGVSSIFIPVGSLSFIDGVVEMVKDL